MPSTYSNLKIELIATGEQSGTWGVTTNTNLGTALEEAITGSADVTFTNGNDTTITLTDTNAAQAARNLRLNLTGSSTGAQNLILGSGCQIEKLYLINNTLGHTITVKNTTGTGIAVPAGKTMFVYNNGTNVVDAVTYLTSIDTGTINATTVDTTNLEVTNLKAKDGTSAGSIANSTGVVTLDSSVLTTTDINGGTIDNAVIGGSTPAAGTFTQINIPAQGDLRLEDTTGGQYVAIQAPGTVASSYTLTLPVDDGTNGQALITDGSGNLSWSTAASGDVYGPASATDNAIARFDLTTGKLIQNSSALVDDAGNVLAGAGLVGAPAFSTTGDTNTGIFFPAADTIAFSEGGVESMRLDSNGRLGIGTTSPTTPLQVNGTITATSVNTNNTFGFKNRIINGAMVIDQRNAGASVTPNNTYTLDRWQIINSQTSKLTVQQSSVAPAGFVNSLLVTSSSAYSIGSGDYFFLRQRIEGFNTADLGWGTASAATVTLSFWVRSSLTGTFGGSLINGGDSRAYPFSYTVSSANTWEQKTITVAGDTTGTWFTNNNIGIAINFGLGVGSTFSGTGGSWQASNLVSSTGATSVVGTNGATFYITGVQLEVGSTATSFDYRPYGTELALCQRYYEVLYADAAGENLFSYLWRTGQRSRWFFQTQKRASPSFGLTSGGSWGVATPTSTNGGINSVGFFHASSDYYLLGAANAAVAFASIEL